MIYCNWSFDSLGLRLVTKVYNNLLAILNCLLLISIITPILEFFSHNLSLGKLKPYLESIANLSINVINLDLLVLVLLLNLVNKIDIL